MMIRPIIAGLLLSFLLLACQPAEPEGTRSETATIETTTTNAADSLLPVDFSLKKVFADSAKLGLKSQVVSVKFDHFFKEEKRYLAFPLDEVLDLHIPEGLNPAELAISFVCTDGYKPSMTLDNVRLKKAYVAYKDLDTPEGQSWPDSVVKKFNPYYLIWEEVPYGNNDFTWPYGLAEITINHFKAEFAGAYPEDPAIAPAFMVFQKRCMKCHAINGVGGIMGPEMNYPKNITEYWQYSIFN